MNEETKEFIKNIIEVEVDGLRCVNHYTIQAMYNKKYVDEQGEYWKLDFQTIDEFDYTWSEIKRDGGIYEVNKQIKEEYLAELEM